MNTDYANKTIDGTCQHLNMYTNKAYREYTPFGEFDYTMLDITNPHHDVNLINQNFINATAQVKITPKQNLLFEEYHFKYGTTQGDIDLDKKNNYAQITRSDIVYGLIGKKVYIGWKNSAEVITEMTVYNNNRETGYQQVYCDRENYLENIKFKTASDKDLPRLLIPDHRSVAPADEPNKVSTTLRWPLKDKKNLSSY